MILDIILGVIILWCGFSGIRSGLIMSLVSFVGLLAAFWLASLHLENIYSSFVNFVKVDYFPKDINENYYIYVISYVVGVIFFYIMIYVIGLLIKSIFGKLMLGWVDRTLGGLFGLIKGYLISFVILSILIFLSKFSSEVRRMLSSSRSIELFEGTYSFLQVILPEDVFNIIKMFVSSED